MARPTPSPARRLGHDLVEALYPRGTAADEVSARLESRATYAAALSFAAAALLGLLLYAGGSVPLWGTFSVGTGASLLGALAGAGAGIAGYIASGRTAAGAWRAQLRRLQRIADTIAITLLHVTILVMAMLAVFFSLQQAFRDLRVDAFTAVMITGIVAAIAAYTMYLSAANLTAQRLSGLLAVFVLVGVMVSMVTAQDPDWWQLHFSELGAGTGFSGVSFNVTLIIAGLVLATLGLYITADLRAWERRIPPSRTRNVALVQAGFVTIGTALIGVGLVPVNANLILHNVFATGMALVFVALLIGLRWVLDGLPRALFVFSDTLIVGIALAAVLWWPVGYYNLTAFELIAAGLIFVWIIVFIRNIGALTPHEERASAPVASTDTAAKA